MLACYNGHTDVVQLLLDHSDPNIDLNTRGDNGFTAFTIACYKGHKDVIQLLMDHSGINLNVRDNTGRTALMIASQRGHNDIVRLLEIKIIQLCLTRFYFRIVKLCM